MASLSIEKRMRANGKMTFRAVIRAKKNGVIIHQESKSFRELKLARKWGNDRRVVIEDEINNGRPHQTVCTIGELIDLYIADRHLWDNTKRTKRYVVELLRDSMLANIDANKLTSQDLVSYCRLRNGAGASPATVRIDISVLKSVMRVMATAYSIAVDLSVFTNAVPVLFEMRLISKSARRSRRPTENELHKIRAALKKRESQREAKIPFTDILDFSILTCMRIGEVCKLRWDDLDRDSRAILIRDRKDPRKKEGNHMWCPLLGGSLDIVERQPKVNELIFPYSPRSVSAGFQRVRNALDINDLRYHDLRREGASRLLELGYNIEEVAQVTGHRNINMLWQVYTELFPGKIRNLF